MAPSDPLDSLLKDSEHILAIQREIVNDKNEKNIQCEVDVSDSDSDHVYQSKADEQLEKDQRFRELVRYTERGPPEGYSEVDAQIWHHEPKFVICEAKNLEESDKYTPFGSTYLYVFFKSDPKTKTFPRPMWIPKSIIREVYPDVYEDFTSNLQRE